jgi:hypothetical protein
MGDIKRQINSITDLKRGSTNVNFVYRGTTLVWERGGAAVTKWLTNGLQTILSDNTAGTNSFVTIGLNTKFK